MQPTKEVYSLSPELQATLNEKEFYKCMLLIQRDQQQQQQLSNQRVKLYEEDLSAYSLGPSSEDSGFLFSEETRLRCNRTWDGMMCWPEATAGSVVRLLCPQYHLFYKNRYASKHCTMDGHWFVHPVYSNTWTDYSECVGDDSLSDLPPSSTVSITNHLGIIKTIYRTGYGLSIISLLIAISTMLYFKRLRCPRNTLHVHLFTSFILRATMWFIRELFVGGLGLPKDVHEIDGHIVFRDDVTHWECRLVMVLFTYAHTSNYMWIFTEGLYLHNLIFVDVFSESSSVKWYIILGWCSSLTFLIPWIIVRAVLENELCWNTNPTPLYFWIIKLPLAISVLANFGFFVHILRELFVKLKASSNMSNSRKHRHRKLAKSTLVLIPLMGVPYVIFLGLPEELNEIAELVKLYFEMFFNSFNGVIVATLYCFINAEVRQELRKFCGEKDSRGQSQYDDVRRVSQLQVSTTGSTHRSCHAHSLSNPTRSSTIRPARSPSLPCPPNSIRNASNTAATDASAFLENKANLTKVTSDAQNSSCTVDTVGDGQSKIKREPFRVRLLGKRIILDGTPEETEADIDDVNINYIIRTSFSAPRNYLRVLPTSDDDLKSSSQDDFNTTESLVNVT